MSTLCWPHPAQLRLNVHSGYHVVVTANWNPAAGHHACTCPGAAIQGEVGLQRENDPVQHAFLSSGCAEVFVHGSVVCLQEAF